jgi:putative SOS response-associated peptidase YedK
MCNLYTVTTNVEALTQLVQTFNRPNLPLLGEIYPRYEAPIIRPTAQGNELTMMAWGVPLPMGEGRKPKLVTNVRNTASPFWRSMMANPDRRCLVPATAFSEWTDSPDPATGWKTCMWFEVPDAELFCFAGIWRPTVEGERFAFLTTEPNRVVAPIHAKAMPVILKPADYQRWLSADFETACSLQQPLDDGALRLRPAPVT